MAEYGADSVAYTNLNFAENLKFQQTEFVANLGFVLNHGSSGKNWRETEEYSAHALLFSWGRKQITHSTNVKCIQVPHRYTARYAI